MPQALQKEAQDHRIALTPAIHLTPDLQVVRPADGRRGWMAIPGLRLRVEF